MRPARDNAERVLRALRSFGAPVADLSVDDLATPGTIFQIGIEPNRVDIITSIEAVTFEEAWSRRISSTYGGVAIALLSVADLLTNKRAVGRRQDLLDVERLERARGTGGNDGSA